MKQLYISKPSEVIAVQITEETFTGDHPNDDHVDHVIYDPVKQTATFPGVMERHVGHIGDWIVCHGPSLVSIMTHRDFTRRYQLAQAQAL